MRKRISELYVGVIALFVIMFMAISGYGIGYFTSDYRSIYDKNFHNNKYGAWHGYDNLMRHEKDRKFGTDERCSPGLSFDDYEKLRLEKMNLIYKNRGLKGGLVWQEGTKNYLTWGTYSNPRSRVGGDVINSIDWQETDGYRHIMPDTWGNKEKIRCIEW
jgi:hypothetical protein